MAKKQTEKFVDITTTGSQSYRDLQNQNQLPEEDKVLSQEDAKKYFKYSGQHAIGLNRALNQQWDDYQEQSSLYRNSGGKDAFGKSMFDDDIVIGDDYNHLSDIRGRNQPWYSQLGASLVKGVGLAGTTFLDGWVGLFCGAVEMPSEGFSALWDNEISNGLHDFNKLMEEWFPNYRTEEEENNAWYQNLGTMNFWADTILKNMGFTVGAYYSGAGMTKGLKLAGSLIQEGGKSLKLAHKVGTTLNTLGKNTQALGLAMQTNSLGAKTVGALFSAVNEGRIEANNNTAEIRDFQVQQASDAFAQKRKKIIDDPTLTSDQKISRITKLENNYNKVLEQIDENVKQAGLIDFALNIPILFFDDFWTFGRMYSQGFRNAKNVATKNVKKSVFQLADEAARNAENTLRRNTEKKAGRYAWKEITKGKSLRKGLLTELREGNEEMFQTFASEFAGNVSFYKDGPDTYYKAMSAPKVLANTMSLWEAASTAFLNTYGNGDRYEEFAAGAITALFGNPTFGRRQNAGANTWLGRNSLIGISGGMVGEFTSNADMNKQGAMHIANMNNALDKRDQIAKTGRIHAAMNQFNNAMDGFAEADDKFEFQNESDNLDWMGITSFISTGREEDLKALLSQDFENISDEELASIAALTSQNDGSGISKFTEKGSGKTITVDSPQSDKDDMRKKLSDAKNKMLDEIEDYKNSIDIIRNHADGNPNITEEEVNELAWMHWKTERFGKRALEIKKEDAEQFTLIAQALTQFINKQQEVLDKSEESTEGLSAAAISVAENKNTKLAKEKEIAGKNLIYAQELLGIINSVAGSNSNIMAALAPLMQIKKDFVEGVLKSDNFFDLAVAQGMSKPEFDKTLRDIRDLGRLAEANQTFNQKLKEYMEDPLKLKKDHDKIDKENEAVASEINKENQRKKAKQATREQMLNGEVDIDEVIKNTKTTDVEQKLAKDAKVTLQVGQRVETLLAKQNQEGTLSDEEVERLEATIQKALQQSKSINDLTGTNASFMVDTNNQPLSDEQISLLQDLMNQAVKEVAEAEGLNINNGEIDFDAIDQFVQDQVGPSDKQTQAAENALDNETTGNDAVEKAVVANNGVQGNPESAIKKRRTNRGTGTSQNKRKGKQNQRKNNTKQTKKEKEAATKAAEQQAKIDAIAQKKNSIVSAAMTFAINGNAINLSTQEGQQETQLLSELLSKAYDLLNEGQLEKLSSILDVLKNMNEYETLAELLDNTPQLTSALTSISDSLNKPFKVEEKTTDNAQKTELEIGPDTAEVPLPTSREFSSGNLNPAITIPNYVAPATSQFYRDPATGQILPVPYTTKMQSGDKNRKKKLVATYNYLSKNNAFKNASKVKVGSTIYFTVHTELNTDAGGSVVILMSTDPEGKHIVGDLADIDSTLYQDNSLLKGMIDRITDEFNNREQTDSNIFVSKETSTVRQTMVGHVMFTNSNKASTDMTLNNVFGNGSFSLGITVRSGDIIDTNQGDESVSNTLDIINPRTRFAPGTPVVLIPTGEGTNKYVPIPFQMSRYTPAMKGSMFHRYVETILKRVLLNNNSTLNNYGTLKDLSTHSQQELVEEALKALFNGLFNVNVINDQLVISKVTIAKDGSGKKETEIIFRGSIKTANIVESILKALQSKEMIIRIDRREINKDTNLKDLDFTYNTMIGELAHTNLSEKSATTVNDWFVINPINKNGEEINISHVEYRDTRTEKPVSQRNDTLVVYKGQNYIVSEEDVVIDKDGNPRTDLSIAEQQIIIAKAELENNDMLTPIGTEGEQVFWYSLANGNLFYNKDGQERVAVFEADKKAVLDSLSKKEEKVDNSKKETTPTITTVSKKELNKNEPSNIEERIIIDSSLGGGMSQVYGYNPNNASNKNDRATAFWRSRVSDSRVLTNPATGKKRENFHIITNQGTSVITFYADKSHVSFGRKDGMGITVWRKLTNEEAKQILDYLWENGVKSYSDIANYVDNVMHTERIEPKVEPKVETKSTPSEPATIDHKYYGYNGETSVKVEKTPIPISELKPGDEFFGKSNARAKLIKALGNNEYLINVDGRDYFIGTEAGVNWSDWLNTNPKVYRVAKNQGYAKPKSETKVKTEIGKKEEIKQSAYPIGFDRQEQKDFFDAISPERQKALKEANSNALTAIMPSINKIIHDFGIEDLDEAEDDLEDIFNLLSGNKYRKQDNEESYETIDIEKEKAWLKKALPQLSDDDHIRIVKGLLKITEKNDPGYAYGKTQRGIMTISDAAATGTVYHESFHSVIDILLSEDEIEKLFKAGSKRYNISRDSIQNALTIEENLAEDFRRYVQNEQAIQEDIDKSTGLSKYFKIIKHTVNTWINNISYINNMFYRINRGKLANREIHEATRDIKNAMRSNIFQDAKNIFFNEVYGRNLSEYDIVYINRKLEQLSDRIGDTPWHLQPSRNGGYYIAGYKNRPVTADNYWSPAFTKFSQYTGEEKAILDKASRNKAGQLLAPNGQVSNLTEKQYAQVRTKAFKEWFGDWENNPQEASKVVDKNGEPLVVYHKSNTSGFTIFNLNESSKSREQLVSYAYHTGTEQAAKEVETYGSIDTEIFKLFLNIKHPVKLTEYNQGAALRTLQHFSGPFAKGDYGKSLTSEQLNYYREKVSMDNSPEDVRKTMEEIFGLMGFDGYYYKNEVEDPESTSWVALNPNQLKSATDNVGAFSTENNDIRYRRAEITLGDIKQYHREKLDMSNLDEQQKISLEDVGIDESHYAFLTQSERENLKMCLI